MIHRGHTIFWNNEILKPRRTRCGKREKHMVLWKGNVLENFHLRDLKEGQNETVNVHHKERSYEDRMWLELAQGSVQRRVMVQATSKLQFFVDL
jgi:hypothetical protein